VAPSRGWQDLQGRLTYIRKCLKGQLLELLLYMGLTRAEI